MVVQDAGAALTNSPICQLSDLSESWRVGKLAGCAEKRSGGVIAECSDCRVMSMQVDR